MFLQTKTSSDVQLLLKHFNLSLNDMDRRISQCDISQLTSGVAVCPKTPTIMGCLLQLTTSLKSVV